MVLNSTSPMKTHPMSQTVTYRGIHYKIQQERVKKTVEVFDKYQIEKAIKTLEQAVAMCANVDYSVDDTDPDNIQKTAPHAVGYSQAAMRSAMIILKELVE